MFYTPCVGNECRSALRRVDA